MRAVSAAILLCLSISTAGAQFIGYPTPGVPRNKDGSPNLAAPAPRTPDRKPDLSGLWDNNPTPCTIAVDCPDKAAIPEFVNLGLSIPGGLPYQPWAAALLQQRLTRPNDDPITRCQPADVFRLLTFPPPRKIIQLPGLLIVLTERDVTYRQIFLDGRPLPKDPQPSFHGYSVGHWDGETLVVETNGLRDDMWIDKQGSPLSGQAKLTERYRRINYGTLEIILTVNDPKTYTAPWTIKITQKLMLNDELMEYFCQENEKDLSHSVDKLDKDKLEK
ncbi:MAG: hypothetical protein ABI995_04725 [Acidobacteriota bacterium]